MVAIALTEQKLPVLDMFKEYETPEYGPGYIQYDQFSVDLMENDFDLKKMLTRNMINVIWDSYGQNQPYLEYMRFIDDLKSLEEANRGLIRIYKT